MIDALNDSDLWLLLCGVYFIIHLIFFFLMVLKVILLTELFAGSFRLQNAETNKVVR